MRKDKGLVVGKREPGKGGYQDMGAKAGDEKHLKITFAVIEKMHYSDFNSGNDAEDFKPSDIIDEEDGTISDDEVLKKFKNDVAIAKHASQVLVLSDFETKAPTIPLARNKEFANQQSAK
jgi:hypothetical protein